MTQKVPHNTLHESEISEMATDKICEMSSMKTNVLTSNSSIFYLLTSFPLPGNTSEQKYTND